MSDDSSGKPDYAWLWRWFITAGITAIAIIGYHGLQAVIAVRDSQLINTRSMKLIEMSLPDLYTRINDHEARLRVDESNIKILFDYSRPPPR